MFTPSIRNVALAGIAAVALAAANPASADARPRGNDAAAFAFVVAATIAAIAAAEAARHDDDYVRVVGPRHGPHNWRRSHHRRHWDRR